MSSTALKILAILTLFDAERPMVTAPAVAARLHLSRSTTYRYLQLLRACGFLAEAGPGAYRLGPQLAALGRLANERREVDEVALPVMRELARQTGETILLTKRVGDQVVTAQRVESPRAVRVSFEPGHPRPLHAGASAKILMAHLSPDLLDLLLKRTRLSALTARTLTNPRALRTDLARIQRRGYAVTTGEVDEGVRGIAVPLRAPGGEVVAGLSLAGPVFRVKRALSTLLARQLQDAARRIEGLLAHPAGAPSSVAETAPGGWHRASVRHRPLRSPSSPR